MKLITPGTLSSILGVAAFALSISGHSALAAVFSDPDFAQNVLNAVGSLATIYAGISRGIHQ